MLRNQGVQASGSGEALWECKPKPQPSNLNRKQVVDSVLQNQGVHASALEDVADLVAECGSRVLKTVRRFLPLPLSLSLARGSCAPPRSQDDTEGLPPSSTLDPSRRFCRRCGGCGRTPSTLSEGGRWGLRCAFAPGSPFC